LVQLQPASPPTFELSLSTIQHKHTHIDWSFPPVRRFILVTKKLATEMEPKMEQELAVEDMDEPKNNYNELYPCPNDKLCAMFKCYMESQAKLRLGQCIKLKGKQLYPLWIKKTIKLFQQYKCNKCTGSHQYLICGKFELLQRLLELNHVQCVKMFVFFDRVGGYASYIANLTNAFSDIDVFIHCNKRMDGGTLNFTSYKIKTNRTVSTIRSKLDNTKPNVQFIQVSRVNKI